MTRDNVPGAMYRDSASPIAEASQNFMRAADRLVTLWSLGQDWDRMLEMEAQPELYSPEDVQRELDRLAGDIRVKAHGVAEVIQKLEHLADEQKGDAKRMADKAKVTQNHADRLRQYALECMQAIGAERIETGRWTLSVRQNPGRVEVLDASQVPSEYTRTKITVDVDKTAVMQAFKATGETVPGTEVIRSDRLAIQ